jgi:hypothetical protein
LTRERCVPVREFQIRKHRRAEAGFHFAPFVTDTVLWRYGDGAASAAVGAATDSSVAAATAAAMILVFTPEVFGRRRRGR